MKKVTVLFLSLFLIFISYCSASSFEGPLQVRNQFPLFLSANVPYMESSCLESFFSTSFSHSSLNLVKGSSEWDMQLDMELTELNIMFRKNIRDFVEVGAELPLLMFSSGFMDGFLNSYHDAFGFPDYGRSSRPDNEFLYEVRRNGNLVIKGENGRIGIGDVRFSIKIPVMKEDPALSIKGNIELPTGDAKAGYGNGNIDAGIALLLDKKLGGDFKSYLNIGAVFPGNLKGHEEVNLREFLYGSAAIEASFWKNISLVAQVFLQDSPFPETDISSVDRMAVLLSFGGRYSSGNNSVEFSFTEDPNTSGAPDFTLTFSFKRNF